MNFAFLVTGSQPDPYEVTFTIDGGNMTALCTCAAGGVGQHCKHRINLLFGDITRLASSNPDDVVALAAALTGTDVQEAMQELQAAEDRLTAAKKTVAQAKKRLAQAFSN